MNHLVDKIFGYLSEKDLLEIIIKDKTEKELENLLNPYVYMVKCNSCFNIIKYGNKHNCDLCKEICQRCLCFHCDMCGFKICKRCLTDQEYITYTEYIGAIHKC